MIETSEYQPKSNDEEAISQEEFSAEDDNDSPGAYTSSENESEGKPIAPSIVSVI